MDAWDPGQYAQFAQQRKQPFVDLCRLIKPPAGTLAARCRSVDLGCGDGRLTAELFGQLGGMWHSVELTGLDNSPAMVRAAQERAATGLSFRQGEISRWAEKALLGEEVPYDLIFSNAALHWVPAHERLFAGLVEALAEGGQLAIQMPANHHHPSQVLARQLASEAPYAGALGELGQSTSPHTVLRPEEYALLLHRYGLAEQVVRLEVYTHPLADSTDVVEWVRGSLLTAYQQRLSPELWTRFLDDYRARLAAEVGSGRPYLLTYNRLLLWGRKA